MDLHPRAIPAFRQCAEFRSDISHKERSGLQCKSSEAKYVSYDELHRYWTHEKIDDLLRTAGIHADIKTVRQDYLQVLSILAKWQATSKYPVLHHLVDLITHENNDASLPWPDAPIGFTDKANFYQFHELQWQFRPVVIDRHRPMFKRQLDPCAILPISQLDSNTEPKFTIDLTQRESTLAAFKVDLDHVPPSSSPYYENDAPIQYVVFKTYRKTELFEDELKAYNTLQSSNIVSYYGSFHWYSESKGRLSTIILELAEEGSLSDLYRRNDPPNSYDGIHKFWMAFVGLVDGVLALHNITNRPGYTINFGPDTGAGKTYGPPELHLGPRVNFNVDTNVDIWAIGCILLEAAVWLTFGEPGRLSFQNQRKREISTLPDEHRSIGCSDAFHNGEGVLKCVQDIRQKIYADGRRCDEITFKIVDHVLSDCLVDGQERATALRIRSKLANIIHRRSTNLADLPPSPASGAQRESWQNTPPVVNGSGPYFYGHDADQTAQTPQRPPLPPTARLHGSEGSNVRPAPALPNELSLPELPTQTSPRQLRSSATEPQQGSDTTAAMQPTHGIPSRPLPVPVCPLSPAHLNTRISRVDTPSRRSSLPGVAPSELHQWIEEYKRTGTARVLPGWVPIKDALVGRDFIIIVDNSRFMLQHRDEVSSLVKDLSYLMKKMDPDGVEVIFTASPTTKYKCENSTKVGILLQNSFGPKYNSSHCKMEHVFDTVLRDVKSRLRKAGEEQRRRVSPFPPQNNPRRGTCGVDKSIGNLIAYMKDHGVPRTDASIQFVRFGQHEIGIQRLTELDDELPKKDGNED
ncbi:serine/threonine protein kinase [Apiospora phragmitis]|uniref:Serine/threonine protein kinase n=1 Tax=Apiospora phragmitis TaxID=2905665 RepID=A0ABR1TNK3_9PEZI